MAWIGAKATLALLICPGLACSIERGVGGGIAPAWQSAGFAVDAGQQLLQGIISIRWRSANSGWIAGLGAHLGGHGDLNELEVVPNLPQGVQYGNFAASADAEGRGELHQSRS